MSGVKTLARLSCLTKYIRLDAFFTTYSTWQFHLRSLLIIIPKTFTCLTSSSSLLLMDRGQQWVFVFAHCILISLHLSSFSVNLRSLDWSRISLMTACMLLTDPLVTVSQAVMSSTYFHNQVLSASRLLTIKI